MNVAPNQQQAKYQSQKQAPTGGFVADADFLVGYDSERNILDPDYNASKMVYEPSPLAAGPTHQSCSSGYITLAFNLALHVATAIVTIVAAAAHLQDDGATKHLTPTHKEDYVSSWCIVVRLGPSNHHPPPKCSTPTTLTR